MTPHVTYHAGDIKHHAHSSLHSQIGQHDVLSPTISTKHQAYFHTPLHHAQPNILDTPPNPVHHTINARLAKV